MLRRDRPATAEASGSAQTDLIRFVRESGLYPRLRSRSPEPLSAVRRAIALARAPRRPRRPRLAVGPGRPTTARRRCASGCSSEARRHHRRSRQRARRCFQSIAACDSCRRRDAWAAARATMRARFGVRTAAETRRAAGRARTAGARPRIQSGCRRRDLAIVGGAGAPDSGRPRPADLALLERLMRRFPALGDARRLGGSIRPRAQRDRRSRATSARAGLPVLEGKHVTPFVVDIARAESRESSGDRAATLLPNRRFDRPRLAYRDVSGVGNQLSRSLRRSFPAGRRHDAHAVLSAHAAAELEQQHFLCGAVQLVRAQRRRAAAHGRTRHDESGREPAGAGVAGTPRCERRIARLAARLAPHARRSRRRPARALQAAVAPLVCDWTQPTFARVLEGFPRVRRRSEREAALARLNRSRMVL